MPGQKTAMLQIWGTITGTYDWPADSRDLTFFFLGFVLLSFLP